MTTPHSDNGSGRAVIEGLEDPRQVVPTLKLIRRGAHEQWELNPMVAERAPRIVARIMRQDPDARVRLEAAKTLVAMKRNNIDALVKSFEAERLDSDETTVNMGVKVQLTPERLRAIADTLDPPEE